ncbi:MAG: hypothetical protein ACTSVZ_13165 [Promethearchaeota archaeon]
MKKSVIFSLALLIMGMLLFLPTVMAVPTYERNLKGFEHGILIDVDGEEYYFAGPGSEPGMTDVPGHTWVQTGTYSLVGRHYNVGPYNANMGTYVPAWWAPMEENGVLLFKVDAIIAPRSHEIAESMAERGFVHYHEILNTETMEEHETLVVWLKHTAMSTYYFVPIPMPMMAHEVTPGVDYMFMPNYMMPYGTMMH